MTDPQLPEPIRPSLQAALLLLARDLIPEGSEVPRSVAEILERTGVSKSQAYEVRARLNEMFPTMFNSAGRPPEPPPEPQTAIATAAAVRDYLMRHPGSACHTGMLRTYSDSFRRFVVSLLEPGMPGAGLSVVELAEVAGVPYGTLKDWLRLPSKRPDEPVPIPTTAPQSPPALVPSSDEPSPPRL